MSCLWDGSDRVRAARLGSGEAAGGRRSGVAGGRDQGSQRSLLCSPVPVFCSVADSHGPNKKFLEDMSDLALKTNCKLIICPQIENRNDRWIQVGAGARRVARDAWVPILYPDFGKWGLHRFLSSLVSQEKPGLGRGGGGRGTGSLGKHVPTAPIIPVSPVSPTCLGPRQSPLPVGVPRGLTYNPDPCTPRS